MKWVRVFLTLLTILLPGTCLAQENRPRFDPIIRSSVEALRDGRITDAEKILSDAVHDLEKSDPQNPRLADYLERLAMVENQLGRREEAAGLTERAYEIDRNAFGPSDMRLTHDLIAQATSARAAGDYGEAERLLNQALEIVRANASKLNAQPNIGMAEGVVSSLVTFYIDRQRWIEAESLLPQETRLCSQIDEAYRSGFGICGRLPDIVTQIHNAEGKSAEIEHLPYAGDYPRELDTLNKAAKKFEADGLYPSAEDTFHRAISLAGKIEADPQNVFDGLVVVETILLGQTFEKEGMKDRAEQTYLSALQMQENNAGPDPGHRGSAATLAPSYLVELYRGEGRLTDAETLLQQVIEIQIRSLGDHNRQVLETIRMLIGIDEKEGESDPAKYAKAVPLYEQALAIQEANLGPNHTQLLGFLGPYAELLDKLHSTAKAAEVRARMAQITSADANGRR